MSLSMTTIRQWNSFAAAASRLLRKTAVSVTRGTPGRRQRDLKRHLPSLGISSWTEFGPVTQIKKLLVRGVEIESSSIGIHDAKSFQHNPLLEWSPQHVIRPMPRV